MIKLSCRTKAGVALRQMQNIIKTRPLDINIETTNKCVLKCKFCCNRIFKRSPQTMDMDLFEKICLDYVSIGGGILGISSMQSDLCTDKYLFDRLEFVSSYKEILKLYSTTPFLLAKSYSDEELIFFLKSFFLLHISVSGHSRESYKEMVGLDSFDIFEENLTRCYELGKKHNLDLKNKIHLCFRTYDIDVLQATDFYKKITSWFSIGEIRDSYFTWFGSIKQGDLPSGAKLVTQNNLGKTENCIVPLASLAVNVDGTVVGCGCIDWNSEHIIGDCKAQTITEIWQSKKCRDFQTVFSRGKIPKLCMECALYTEAKTSLQRSALYNYKPTNGLYYMAT